MEEALEMGSGVGIGFEEIRLGSGLRACISNGRCDSPHVRKEVLKCGTSLLNLGHMVVYASTHGRVYWHSVDGMVGTDGMARYAWSNRGVHL